MSAAELRKAAETLRGDSFDLMDPTLAVALAPWLDDEANAVAAYHANKANPFALDLARLINGGANA